MKLLALLLTATLAGCAGSVVASSPRSVVVHLGNVTKAQALADAECAKHNRLARFAQERPDLTFSFDCVE